MKSISDILHKFDPLEDKYISREFQAYGCYLAEKLQEEKRKSLFIRLAKVIPRPILEEALRFVVDSNARSKGALFMWKLKEMGAWERYYKGTPISKKRKTTKKKKKALDEA